MSTARRIAALLLVIVLAAGLAACAAGSGSSPSGTYFAVRLVKGGVEADAEELAQSGGQISVTFEPDGTGVLRFNAANEPFTWSGSTMIPLGGGNSIEFRFDGETVILERDDTLIEFR